MKQIPKKKIYLGFIKYAILPWAVLFFARYLYYYGFRLVSLSIITDERFIVDSIMQFVVLCALYALNFTKSKKSRAIKIRSVSKRVVFDTDKRHAPIKKIMRNFLIMLAFVLSLTQLAFAKEWNGIKPLQTTRAEVIKLLGEPKLPNDAVLGERFKMDGENVYVIWIRADCRDEEKIIAGTPPIGLNVVVNQITVDPKSLLTIEDVKKIDPPKESPTLPGFFISGAHNCIGSGGKWACSVSNDESGFGYGTNTDGQVDRLYYNAAEKEQKSWNEKLLPCVKEMK